MSGTSDWNAERRSKELTAVERAAVRQRDSLHLLNAGRDWLMEQKLRVLPKSPLGQAISYALANWQVLCRYPEDGELTIDNNLSQRTAGSGRGPQELAVCRERQRRSYSGGAVSA